MDDGVLKQLAVLAGELCFRPEIQVRGKRIVAYLADQNATVDEVKTLETLFEFTKRVASI
ncbi:MAG: hypothetical protein ACMUJM_25700 [bacterium]